MSHKTHILIVFAMSIVMIFLYGQIDYFAEQFSDLDLWHYLDIAKASPRINKNVAEPYIYRLLGPYIVGLLPIPEPLGFYILTIISSVSLVILLYFFLCHLGIQPNIALFTTILFIFNRYLFGFNIWNYFQINDLLSLIYTIVSFWAVLNRKWIVFSITMFLGALTRETPMTIIPVSFFYLAEKNLFGKEGKKFLFAITSAIVCFIMVRLVLAPAGKVGLLYYPSYFQNILENFVSMESWFRALINPFIPLSFLPIVFIKDTILFFKDKKYMLFFFFILASVSILGGHDGVGNERHIAPAFVIFYPLIASIIQNQFRSNKIMLFILLICTFVSSFHYLYARYPIIDRNFTIILSLVFLMIVAVVSYLFKIRFKHRE